MELLLPVPRGTPLEEHHRVRSVRDGLEGSQSHAARLLDEVERPLADGTAGLLHHQPRLAAFQRTHQVVVERGSDVRFGVGGVGIDVKRDSILFRCPAGVIGAREKPHEVRQNRNLGRDRAHDVALLAEAVEQQLGGEAFEVELTRRIHVSHHRFREVDLTPVAVALTPERRAPVLVESVQRPVSLTKPVPKSRTALIAEALRVILVADVPHRQSRVVAVSLRERSRNPLAALAVHRRRRAEVRPTSDSDLPSFPVRGKHLRMLAGEPRRRGRVRRAEVHRDAVIMQDVHHLVEPSEIQSTIGGLQRRPREDSDAHQSHAGLLHERSIFQPDLTRPLIRVVVAAVDDAGEPVGEVADGVRHVTPSGRSERVGCAGPLVEGPRGERATSPLRVRR